MTRHARRRDDEFAFAWVLVLVGLVLAALLVEVDPEKGRLTSANWFGVYLLGTHLLFIVACAEFFAAYGRMSPAERRAPLPRIAWVLLALLVVSGAVYLIRLSLVKSAYA